MRACMCAWACNQSASGVVQKKKEREGEDVEKVQDMGMGMATATVVGERGDGEQQCSKQSK